MKKIYDNHILPHLVHRVCSHERFEGERGKIAPLASGVVLELGIGSGLNLPFYDAGKVVRVIGVDPSGGMLKKAGARADQADFEVELKEQGASNLPVDTASIDTVLSTFTLCTIADLQDAFVEARRVLKPGGRLLFCEHGLAPDASVARWQNLINPVWRPFAGGCNLNRAIPELVMASGFDIEDMDEGYLDGAPGIGGYLYRGSAIVL